jgi:hypothetical protein
LCQTFTEPATLSDEQPETPQNEYLQPPLAECPHKTKSSTEKTIQSSRKYIG